MNTVGIRELKTHLSRHLKRVRAGTRLLVTERGRIVATISPVGAAAQSPDLEWAQTMVAQGRAQRSGGKPQGSARPVTLTSGPTMSDAVLEDRR
jgi:prevent-host-death family protein